MACEGRLSGDEVFGGRVGLPVEATISFQGPQVSPPTGLLLQVYIGCLHEHWEETGLCPLQVPCLGGPVKATISHKGPMEVDGGYEAVWAF